MPIVKTTGVTPRITPDKETRYNVNIIDDAVSLLTLLFAADRRMSLSELTLASGMSKNKTFRLLATLELQGILDKDKQGKYYLGIKTFFAARHALTRIDIPELFPFLENVALQLNEEVYLARNTTGQSLLVAVANSRQQVTVRSCIGCVLRYTGSEITKELGSCHRLDNGVRVSVGALDPEVTTVAIYLPVFREQEPYALVVVAPTFRLPLERVRTEVIPVLRETVRQLEHLETRPMSQSMMRRDIAGSTRRAQPRAFQERIAGLASICLN